MQIIKNEKEYHHLIEWVDTQFDLDIAPNTIDGGNLQAVLLLIKDYEDKHYSIPST